jgi:hypothetical protein
MLQNREYFIRSWNSYCDLTKQETAHSVVQNYEYVSIKTFPDLVQFNMRLKTILDQSSTKSESDSNVVLKEYKSHPLKGYFNSKPLGISSNISYLEKLNKEIMEMDRNEKMSIKEKIITI